MRPFICTNAALLLVVCSALTAHALESPSVSHEQTRKTTGDLTPENRSHEVSQLRAEYNLREQQAARLAKKYRELGMKAARVPGDAEVLEPQTAMAAQALKVELAMALKVEIAIFVKRAFEARQKLQQAELAQLRQRLVRIEQRIATRQRLKSAIVDRRVAELLDPALRWEGDREAIGGSATPPKSQGRSRTAARLDPLDLLNPMSALQGVFSERDATRTQMEPLLLFFHAAWCPVCQRLKPEIEKLQKEGLSILDVDVDVTKLRKVQHTFQVDTLPTLILLVDGIELDRVLGMEIEPLIERYRDESSGTDRSAASSSP